MEKLELKEMRVLFLTCGKIVDGEFVYFADNKKGWFVGNRGETYNAQLFAQGIKKIFEWDGKRGEWFQLIVNKMSRTFEDELDEPKYREWYGGEMGKSKWYKTKDWTCLNKWYCSEQYSDFIKFVCNVALKK